MTSRWSGTVLDPASGVASLARRPVAGVHLAQFRGDLATPTRPDGGDFLHHSAVGLRALGTAARREGRAVAVECGDCRLSRRAGDHAPRHHDLSLGHAVLARRHLLRRHVQYRDPQGGWPRPGRNVAVLCRAGGKPRRSAAARLALADAAGPRMADAHRHGPVRRLRPLHADPGPPAGTGRGAGAIRLHPDLLDDHPGLHHVRRPARPVDAHRCRHRHRRGLVVFARERILGRETSVPAPGIEHASV